MTLFTCRVCHNKIKRGNCYFSTSDSYEDAELGHLYSCPYYLYDFVMNGSFSKDIKVSDVKIEKNRFIEDEKYKEWKRDQYVNNTYK